MKDSSHISAFRKSLFFVLGLLVAAFVVSQEVISHHCTKIAQAAQQQAGDVEEGQSDLIYEYSCDVMLPIGGANLLKPFTPSFVLEIVQESEDPQFVEFEVPLHNTPHYKTLFRQFISTNAP